MKLKAFCHKNKIRLYLLLALIGLELLMSFSFLGYVHVEPISITFSYIPVMLAGALLGIPDAVAVGAVFGLASMWKAGANYVLPTDQLFSPFMSGHPLESLLLSVGARMLFGLLIGLLFYLAKRVRFAGLWVCVVAFWGKLLHSVLVYGCMGLLFPESGYHAGSALQNLMSPSDTVANLVTMGIVLLFWLVERSNTWRQFCQKLQKVQSRQWGGHYHKFSIAIVVLLAVVLSMFVGIYFVNRMESVLSGSGIALSKENSADLLHLQVQFLIGILSLMTLLAIFLLFNRQYAAYMEREADTDNLTGVMTRRAFFKACQNDMAGSMGGKEADGSFMMVDLDHFKQINDQYGHPQGDQALRGVAWHLREIFGAYGPVGRLGGDEFAVLLQPPVSEQTLQAELERFLSQVHELDIGGQKLSCSIGVVFTASGKTIDELYKKADGALYRAKQQGRGHYVIGPAVDPEPIKK